ncbi:cation:proton antiporter [Collinsella sp. AGMB00827]|uniref:Cation:proton antiporter n=1 Tax=Collinsella ureilytica TaxID=2869515 RepID=A0ABS7MK40_9ACTN|nr:cation:proton antiporter [Collinsella urealyticum]MBY4797734.1 cation:proton antiporter [Collinsella urealyticum]
MHGETILLLTFVLALVAAFAGGMAARMLKLPPIVGYLIGGLAVGPFTPGFIGDSDAMAQLAEIGVMFIMFGTGLHFSLKDLNEVKGLAVPGAAVQITLGTLAGYALGLSFGWTPEAGIVLGLAVSVASTVVLIKNLTDAGLYQTVGGRVATGWLIVEDLATIVILVVLPVVFGPQEVSGAELGIQILIALAKTVAFVALMLVVGAKVLPVLLSRIAAVAPRELFQLAVVVVALGTAMLAAVIFDLSVALGAFLAGVVVSGSKISHRVAAESIPFQDLFSIIFFASVGMMVNPMIFVENLPQLLALAALVMVGKWFINMGLGMIFSAGLHTSLTVGAGLSQIGEFSFIIGQVGMALGVLNPDQYSLILGAAVVSIALNSFVFKLEEPFERWVRKHPALARLFERHAKTFDAPDENLANHVVVIGYGRAGAAVTEVLSDLDVPVLVVERDLPTAEEAEERGVPVLVGDAANSEILSHAHLDRARNLVITTRNESSAIKVALDARAANPELPMAALAITDEGIEEMVAAGVREIIRPDLEGGIELLRYTLLDLGLRSRQIQGYVDELRSQGYEALDESARPLRKSAFEHMMASLVEADMTWVEVGAAEVFGKTLAELDLRVRTGAQAVVVCHQGEVAPIVRAGIPIAQGDALGLIGTDEEIEAAVELLGGKAH